MTGKLAPPTSDVAASLEKWADAEFSDWTGRIMDPGQASAEFVRNNRNLREMASFMLNSGRVTLLPKDDQSLTSGFLRRSDLYKRMIEQSLQFVNIDRPLALQIYIGDRCSAKGVHYPLMVFENTPGSGTMLVPDFEFERDDYYENERHFRDDRDYRDKDKSASFAGATTGTRISMEVATNLLTERLSAFMFFRDYDSVDFTLPNIVQCSSKDVEDYLRTLGVGLGGPKLWKDQFRHRFLISMDGNGATCSRVAIILQSNCALMKYHSDHKLWYFRGLEPNKHYIDIRKHSDVVENIENESSGEKNYEFVANEGKNFSQKFLSRNAVLYYFSAMINNYNKIVNFDSLEIQNQIIANT